LESHYDLVDMLWTNLIIFIENVNSVSVHTVQQ